tara:strand:+ start:117 stop:386 length:270 start_codon:yes stop_codon:yes gene_type:complete
MTKDISPELIANWHKEIEEFLTRTSHRETFTATEIQDFLLDLRNLSSQELDEIEHIVDDAATLAASVENPTVGVGNPAGASSESDPTVA